MAGQAGKARNHTDEASPQSDVARSGHVAARPLVTDEAGTAPLLEIHVAHVTA